MKLRKEITTTFTWQHKDDKETPIGPAHQKILDMKAIQTGSSLIVDSIENNISLKQMTIGLHQIIEKIEYTGFLTACIM